VLGGIRGRNNYNGTHIRRHRRQIHRHLHGVHGAASGASEGRRTNGATVEAKWAALLHRHNAALKCGDGFLSAPEGKLKATNLPEGGYEISVKGGDIYLGKWRCEFVPVCSVPDERR